MQVGTHTCSPDTQMGSEGSCATLLSRDAWTASSAHLRNVSFLAALGDTLHTLEARQRFVVNIGAADGMRHDPTRTLFELGFSGIQLEGNMRSETALKQFATQCTGNVSVHIGFVLPSNVVGILRKHRAPPEMAALKIDVDSIDYPLLESIVGAGYRPLVIMAEINPDIPPPFAFHVEWAGPFRAPGVATIEGAAPTGFYGVSLQALMDLLQPCGYALVAIERSHTTKYWKGSEHNAWFMRKELVRSSHGLVPLRTQEAYDQFWQVFKFLSYGDCLHATPCPAKVMHSMATAAGYRGDQPGCWSAAAYGSGRRESWLRGMTKTVRAMALRRRACENATSGACPFRLNLGGHEYQGTSNSGKQCVHMSR